VSTIREIHTALEAALDTVEGLRVFDTPPQSPQYPCAYPVLNGWEPTTFTRLGHKRYEFTVYVLTAETARPQDGYRLLMDYADAGSKSIDLAIWDANNRAAGTFGGLTNTTAAVTGFRILGSIDVDEFQAYGGVFTVEVLTKG